MARSLAHLPHVLDAEARTCRVVVETPKGSRSKYAFDPEICAFRLKKLLPEGMSFPMDFGFVPSTKAPDGDPLDVLVLHDEPVPMGAVVEVRLIGVIEAEQTERGQTKRNDRVLAICAQSQLYQAFETIESLGGDFLDHVQQFFVNYNQLAGKRFHLLAVRGPDAAVEAIRAGEV